jgi:hypothetical protein
VSRNLTYKGDRLSACTREELVEAVELLTRKIESDRRVHDRTYRPRDEISETLELSAWHLSVESDEGMRFSMGTTVYAKTAEDVQRAAIAKYGTRYSIQVRPA